MDEGDPPAVAKESDSSQPTAVAPPTPPPVSAVSRPRAHIVTAARYPPNPNPAPLATSFARTLLARDSDPTTDELSSLPEDDTAWLAYKFKAAGQTNGWH